MQYNRLDPSRGVFDHLRELRKQVGSTDTAPTGDVGLSGSIVATDETTGVETIIGRLPDGSTGIRQWVNDITPPGQPTTPSAAPTLGGAIITWDGLVSGGTAQPEDYDRTEVEYSTDGSIWAKGGTLTRANSYTVPSLTVGTQYSFRLISYDKNNNASTPSGIVTATPVAIIQNADLDKALQDLRAKDTQLTNDVTASTQAAQDAMDAALEASGLAGSKGQIWWQNDAPASGTTYEWAGTPGVSESIKRLNGVETRRNLFRPNPSFDTDMGYWSGNGVSGITAAWDGTVAKDGKGSIKVTTNGTATGAAFYNSGTTTRSKVTAGTTYTVGLWVKGSGGTVRLEARAVVSSGTAPADTLGTNITLDGTWQLVTVTFTASEFQTEMYPILRIPNAEPISMNVDSVIMETGTTVGEYFDGDSFDDRKNDLWADTNDGNKPYRWDSTTHTWVEATEQAIIDATNTAAKAQGDATKAINDAGLAMTAAGERSRIVHLDTTPPTPTNGWKDGDVWYKHSTADIKSPIVDWYIWKTNTWEVQELHESFLPLVNIGAGTYGTLRGNSFAARSISAEALIIGDFTNLWQNPDFEGDTVGQQAASLTPNTSVLVISGGANGSGKALSLPARTPGDTDVYDNNMIHVKPGDEFFLSAYAKFANTVGTGTGKLGFRTYDATKTAITSSSPIAISTKTTTWPANPFTGSYVVPAGTYFIQPWISFSDNGETTNAFHIDDIEIRRKNAGNLIVDGAIDGKTITGALVQSRAEANLGIKLSGSQFVAYSDTGTETLRLDGTNAILTGAVVRTAPTGARVQLDSTGLQAWDANNSRYMVADSTGLQVTGVFKSGAPGATVQMLESNTRRRPKIEFDAGVAVQVLAGVTATGLEEPVGGYDPGTIVMLSAEDTVNSSGRGEVKLEKGGDFYIISAHGTNGSRGVWGSGDRLYMYSPETTGTRSYMEVAPTFARMRGNGTAMVSAVTDNVQVEGSLLSISGTTNFGGALSYKNLFMGTSGAAAVAYANGWVDFGTGYAPLRTMLIGEGTVVLTGMPKPGTKTDGVVIGYLSPSHTPIAHQYLPCTIRAGTAQYPGMLRLGTDGSIQLYSGGNHASISYLAVGTVYNIA